MFDLNLSKLLFICIFTAILLSALPPASASRAQPQQLAIHDIQGSGQTSPHAGKMVMTSGVVTGVKNNGFFLQAPDNQADGDPKTSEGIFVFTSQAPTVIAGQSVAVTGTVTEFRPSTFPTALPLTEITFATITPLVTLPPLPDPVTITAADANPAGPVDQLEKYEGMRVRVEQLTVIAPTGGSVNEQTASSTSNGVFFGVIAGVARPFREPGLEVFDPLPAGAPCCVPRFDGNPERIRVDSRAITANTPDQILNVAAGATLTNLVGPLDYVSGNYTLLPVSPQPAGALNPAAQPVPAPAANEFTVATFNMQRFFDTTNDAGVDDVALTQAAFDTRLNKASLAVRNILLTPDVIGVEEVENLTTLQAIAAKINSDAGAASPNYRAYLVEGNDIGGIDVGFLVKSSRVTVVDVTQIGKTATYIDPTNNQPATLNDRPPLVLRATIQPPGGGAFPITVIINHLRSLSGIDSATTGARVRAKRRAQAEFLADLIQSRQTASPNERIISAGDYNAFQFNDGYVDTIGAIKGAPTPASQVVLSSSDLVNPDLINLIDLASRETGYSYSFDGNAQTIDHILVTTNLLPLVRRVEIAHFNADFPETLRSQATRPERISDHDVPIAYFGFAPAPSLVTSASAASYRAGALAGESIVAAFGPGLSATTEIATAQPLPTSLGGVSVKVRDRLEQDRLAPLFFVSPNQINYLMPAGVSPGAAMVSVVRNNADAFTGNAIIEPVAPGLFTANADGAGVPAAAVLRVRADGSQSYEPAARLDPATSRFVPAPIDLGAATDQVFLILYGTGLRNRSSLAGVTAKLGGTDGQVLFAGAQAELAGLDQINILIPRSLAGRGEIAVAIMVDGNAANEVRINIK
ncbi:MAG: endonuclease/exonuclease/phosphatase family protein [Blastocatellia bacterium]